MKTNRTLKLITLTAAIFGFAATSFGQITASDNAAAFATIIRPITLTNTGELQFGVITADSDGGSVAVSPSDGTANPSGVVLYTSGDNFIAPRAASYTVTGEASYKYSITLPSADISLSGPTGSTPMTVGTFLSDKALADNTFDGTGNASFNVGATLTIGENQAAGLYTGEFTVKVDYE